jgi:ubiquinol-cytochrome c reductase cytochrome c subunit
MSPITHLRGRRSSRARPILIAAVATGALVALGNSFGAAQAPSPSPLGAPEGSARLLYLRDCAWCHGSQGDGTDTGPSLIGVGAMSADFMLTTGRMPIPEVEIQPRRKKPIYSPAQIEALVRYVATFGQGPAVPRVDPAAGGPGEGAELYEQNCAACHSSTGVGGALTSGLQAPSMVGSTPRQIVEAMRLGGAGLRTGKMPKFGPDVLDDQQVNSIVRYVQYLQHPNDRGGGNLGHIGPVVEGFVAWAGGLLILVLFVRWIGKKTT